MQIMGLQETEKKLVPAIISVGMALGGRRVTNNDMDEFLGRKKGLTERLMRGVGIKDRYHVIKGQTSSDLGAAALQEAIINGKIDLSRIRSLFFAGSSQDMRGVSTAAIVQFKLGLSKWMTTINNSDACAGFLGALEIGINHLKIHPGDNDLSAVIGAEILSLSIGRDNEFSHEKRRKEPIAVLLGDGAGAVILENVIPDKGAPTKMGFASGSDGKHAKELGIEAGGCMYPLTEEALRQGRDRLAMDGKLVFDHAVKYMTEATRRALADAGMDIKDINWLVPHQANRLIIEAVAEELEFPMEKVVVTIDRYGNTSSASIPMALHDAIQGAIPGVEIDRNQILAMTTFGAGFLYRALVLPMVGLPKR